MNEKGKKFPYSEPILEKTDIALCDVITTSGQTPSNWGSDVDGEHGWT